VVGAKGKVVREVKIASEPEKLVRRLNDLMAWCGSLVLITGRSMILATRCRSEGLDDPRLSRRRAWRRRGQKWAIDNNADTSLIYII
jgi:hypothetical protein